jgi:hypothetical protein
VAAAVVSGPVAYEPTGDVGLDVALDFVGKLGLGPDHPAMAATATGDFSLIKAHLATMGDKATGWEQMVALAEAANTRATTAATATATAVSAAVHSVAGGEAEWNTIAAWAAINADPAEKQAINAMFDAGPVQARAAATMLLSAYNAAPGTVVKPAAATTGTASAAGTATTNGPLTTRQYSDAVRDLSNRIGSSNLPTSPEYAALGRRLSA